LNIRATAEKGTVEQTSKRNHVQIYLLAMLLRLSTSKYVLLSRYATKKVIIMSIARKLSTMRSATNNPPLGSSINPNSNSETHAE
jgi:hypothetical protein